MEKIFLLQDRDEVRSMDFTGYTLGRTIVFKLNGRFDGSQEGVILACPQCGQPGLRCEDSRTDYDVLVLHRPGHHCVLKHVPEHARGCPEVACPRCGRPGWQKEIPASFSQEVLTVVYHGDREDLRCEISRRPKEFPYYLATEELGELATHGRVVIPASRGEMMGNNIPCWHRGSAASPTDWWHDPSDRGRGPGWVRISFSSEGEGETTIISLAQEGERRKMVGESWDTVYYRITWDNPASHELCMGCGMIVKNPRPAYENYARLKSEGEPGSGLGRSLTYEPGDPY